MNREQAIRYLKKHQPNSRWIPTEPTERLVKDRLRQSSVEGRDVLDTEHAYLMLSTLARGRKLPFDLIASLARRKAGGVSKV